MHQKSSSKRIFTLICILCLITACGAGALYAVQSLSATPADGSVLVAPTSTDGQEPSDPFAESSEEVSLPPEEPPFEEYTISLMALGDNLMHMGIVHTGRQSDGSLNYDFLFQHISPFLDSADIKIINQETIFGGNDLGFSGYPYFNSPTEVGDGIADAGFNVVLQASNHSADQGLDGIKNCISFWKTRPEVLMIGLHDEETQETGRTIPLLTIKDVTFAVLNYTYGPNMGVVPASIRGYLDVLCACDERGALDFTTINPRVLEDIKTARELADVVIVCPHWGNEYSKTPSSYQEKFALQMTEAGADLIIGTHPHVVEPIRWINAENGNRSLCYYSLGNYVSTMQNPLCMLEGMAWVTFDVKEDGVSISEEKSGVVPLVCDYKAGPLRLRDVYLVEEYTQEQAAKHGVRDWGNAPLTLSDLLNWQDEILGDFVLTAENVLGSGAFAEDPDAETE